MGTGIRSSWMSHSVRGEAPGAESKLVYKDGPVLQRWPSHYCSTASTSSNPIIQHLVDGLPCLVSCTASLTFLYYIPSVDPLQCPAIVYTTPTRHLLLWLFYSDDGTVCDDLNKWAPSRSQETNLLYQLLTAIVIALQNSSFLHANLSFNKPLSSSSLF